MLTYLHINLKWYLMQKQVIQKQKNMIPKIIVHY